MNQRQSHAKRVAMIGAFFVVPIILLVMLLKCDPKNNRTLYLLQLCFNGKVARDFGRNYTGQIWEWYFNGSIESLRTYEKGVLHGRQAAWSLDGRSIYDCIYKEGKPWNGKIVLAGKRSGDQMKITVIVNFASGNPTHAVMQHGKPFTGAARWELGPEKEFHFLEGFPVAN